VPVDVEDDGVELAVVVEVDVVVEDEDEVE
jgi:hypothetical protein